MNISSQSFKNSGDIPLQHSCDGSDISPSLQWDDIPEGTRSFALICDDPDALGKPWVHWIVYNLPPEARSLPENFSNKKPPVPACVEGINSWGNKGYGGPCPPEGLHRYYFRLYALDTLLEYSGDMDKEGLLAAMKGHILGEAEIMGRYSRNITL